MSPIRLVEQQGKALFRTFGIPVPAGHGCGSLEEVRYACRSLAGPVVLKVQIAGGKRGKAGGIRFAESAAEAEREVADLLGAIVNGCLVKEVLVERKADIVAELYAAVLTDTSPVHPQPMLMVSTQGGMEIEEIAKEHRELIHTVYVDPAYGLHDYQARGLAMQLAPTPDVVAGLSDVLKKMYRLYWEMDAELVEINPLCVTASGEVLAVDSKVNLDDSARYRHPEMQEIADHSLEAHAASLGLAFVELDGNIAIVSNGAGLTMATMDHLALKGGRPANFLDTGERILRNGIPDSLDLLLRLERVDAILINVFGGGVRCDVIAEKIAESVRARPLLRVPLVVSLNGRNAEAGRKTLADAGLPGVYIEASIEAALDRAIELTAR